MDREMYHSTQMCVYGLDMMRMRLCSPSTDRCVIIQQRNISMYESFSPRVFFPEEASARLQKLGLED